MLDLRSLRKFGVANGSVRDKRRGFRSLGVSSGKSARYLAKAFYWPALIAGFAAAVLFAVAPQMQNLYLGLADDGDYGRASAALASVALLSAYLFAWTHVEVSSRIDAIYSDHADIHFDRRVVDIGDLSAAFAASLPFFGLFIGLSELYRDTLDAMETLLPGNAPPAITMLPGAVAGATAIALLAYLASMAVFYRFLRKTEIRKRLLQCCDALVAVLLAAPLFFPDPALTAARFLGPLAVATLALLGLTVAARLLFWLLRRVFLLALMVQSSFVMRTDWLPRGLRQAAFATVPLLAVFGIAASNLQPRSNSIEVDETATPVDRADNLEPMFRAWLSERKTLAGRYPVFVVAAEGGGLYTASTTAAFLASLQDRCPAFARHVFAISAVSGGSVGASLFNATLADSIARGTNRKIPVDVEPDCGGLFAEPGDLSRRLSAIAEDDYVSPMLVALARDFLRELVPGNPFAENGEASRTPPCDRRAGNLVQVLEKSFIESFRRSAPDGANDDCSDPKLIPLLARPFSEGWSPSGDLPALILNATEAETGSRVAFAPFSLGPFGGGTLYDFGSFSPSAAQKASLIEAAFVSARFPAIMPPWTLDTDNSGRSTFVDGGAADSSGTAAALQLYNKLKPMAGNDVDLYLIALTDKVTATAPASSALAWLFRMRDLEAQRAVTKARTELGDKMIVVETNRRAFPLPMGWKLSGVSNDIIRLSFGDPQRCESGGDRRNTVASIASRNACEMKRIVDLLSPKAAPSLALFAKPAAADPKPLAANATRAASAPKSAPPPPKALNAWAPARQ